MNDDLKMPGAFVTLIVVGQLGYIAMVRFDNGGPVIPPDMEWIKTMLILFVVIPLWAMAVWVSAGLYLSERRTEQEYADIFENEE